jgi:hypothetical protein
MRRQPVVCTAADQRHDVGTGNPSTGGLESRQRERYGVQRRQRLHADRHLSSGTCGGSNAVVCTAADHVTTPAAAIRRRACARIPTAERHACTDGNACTQTDTCQSGTCAGSNRSCCAAAISVTTPAAAIRRRARARIPKANGTACTRHTPARRPTLRGHLHRRQPGGLQPISATTPAPAIPARHLLEPEPRRRHELQRRSACTQTDTRERYLHRRQSQICTALDQCHDAGTCDPGSGTCSTPNSANGTSCSDGSECTTNDVCTDGACAGGAPPSCDDSNACTDDSCAPATGCTHADNSNSCDDGDACTTSDVCSAGTCTGSVPLDCDDGNVCTDDSCVPATGCSHSNNTDPCSDSSACTLGDACSGGTCQPGTPRSCDDVNPCTDDT